MHIFRINDLCTHTYSGFITKLTPGVAVKPEVKGARASFLIRIKTFDCSVNKLDHPVLELPIIINIF